MSAQLDPSLAGTYIFVCKPSDLSTSLLWVKITSRKEKKSVVYTYTVEYSYGEIKVLNHHEISFIKYSNDCNKRKTSNDNIFSFGA